MNKLKILFKGFWLFYEGSRVWTQGDSNSRPPRCQRGALPAEPWAHMPPTGIEPISES
jgi:hypothetical protein